jgi:hypothetical protein
MVVRRVFTPEQIKAACDVGIDSDETLSQILRSDLSSNDSGHLRNVVRMLVNSHLAANERIRELEENLRSMAGKTKHDR